jgi:hypothetical protein
MRAFLAVLAAIAKPLLFCLLGVTVLVGLIAVVHPRAFSQLVAKGNQWVDTNRLFGLNRIVPFRFIDRPYEVLDHRAVRYARPAGLAMIAGALTVALCWLA